MSQLQGLLGDRQKPQEATETGGRGKKEWGWIGRELTSPASIDLDTQPCHTRSPPPKVPNQPCEGQRRARGGGRGVSLSWRALGLTSPSPLPELLCAPDTLSLPPGLSLPLCDLDLANLQNSVSGLSVPICSGRALSCFPSVHFRLEGGEAGRSLPELGQIWGAMVAFWGEMWCLKTPPPCTQQPQLPPRALAVPGQSLCRPLASPDRVPAGGGSWRCKCAQPPFF